MPESGRENDFQLVSTQLEKEDELTTFDGANAGSEGKQGVQRLSSKKGELFCKSRGTGRCTVDLCS